jgi:hypothetical protein
VHKYAIDLLRKVIRAEVQMQNDKTGVITSEFKLDSKAKVQEINFAIAALERNWKAPSTSNNKQSAEYLCVCGSSTVYKSVNGSAFRCMDCHRMWKV